MSESATITHVDPGTLLVDLNVRNDLHLDRHFVESIRDLGVLVPIVAVRTKDGSLRVRFGHRRTLAAVAAELPYVAVVVAADETVGDPTEIERLLGQYAENQHRLGLKANEQAQVFTQLNAFGVSAAQIAKRAKARRKDVDAALTVGRSELATAIVERHDFLDLIQAAAIAEFDDDADAVKRLVKAARDGGFEHLLQRLRDERADAAAVAKITDELVAAGVHVIEPPSYLDRADDVGSLFDPNGERFTAEPTPVAPATPLTSTLSGPHGTRARTMALSSSPPTSALTPWATVTSQSSHRQHRRNRRQRTTSTPPRSGASCSPTTRCGARRKWYDAPGWPLCSCARQHRRALLSS